MNGLQRVEQRVAQRVGAGQALERGDEPGEAGAAIGPRSRLR